MTRISLAAVLFAACGGDDLGGTPDAATQIDAPTAKVVQLATCPGTVSATVMDSASAFVPKDTTISVGGIVKIVTTAEHTLIPNTLVNTDAALTQGRGQTKCYQFNVSGTYGIACGVHGFAGTITAK
jgi:plastocyanin